MRKFSVYFFVQSTTTGLWSLFSLQYAASLTEVTFSTWSPFSRKNDEEMQSFHSEADHVMCNQLIVLLFVCHTRAICRPLFRFSPRLWKFAYSFIDWLHLHIRCGHSASVLYCFPQKIAICLWRKCPVLIGRRPVTRGVVRSKRVGVVLNEVIFKFYGIWFKIQLIQVEIFEIWF